MAPRVLLCPGVALPREILQLAVQLLMTLALDPGVAIRRFRLDKAALGSFLPALFTFLLLHFPLLLRFLFGCLLLLRLRIQTLQGCQR